MENYSKGKNVEEPLSVESIPIPNLPQDLVWMHVRGGSKMRKVLEPALKAFNENKSVLWTGEGPSLGKAISCAEVMKRKFDSIHQFNHICYRRCQEFWDPKFEGMDPLVVNRDVPVIHILLSREPINKELPGYQPPKGGPDSKRPQEKRRSKPKKMSGPHQEEMEKFGLRFDKRKPKKPRQNQMAHDD
uniref:Alba-like protein C9orf23 n=1 Tax=Lygus hesperus TaxID=30085 RepID=A0A0A9WJ94_LYGHE